MAARSPIVFKPTRARPVAADGAIRSAAIGKRRQRRPRPAGRGDRNRRRRAPPEPRQRPSGALGVGDGRRGAETEGAEPIEHIVEHRRLAAEEVGAARDVEKQAAIAVAAHPWRIAPDPSAQAREKQRLRLGVQGLDAEARAHRARIGQGLTAAHALDLRRGGHADDAEGVGLLRDHRKRRRRVVDGAEPPQRPLRRGARQPYRCDPSRGRHRSSSVMLRERYSAIENKTRSIVVFSGAAAGCGTRSALRRRFFRRFFRRLFRFRLRPPAAAFA